MAQPSNTFDTYDAIGIREDLFDGIFNVDPDETPFLAKISKVKASNTFHEWQTDALDSPSAMNTNIEGDDTVAGVITPTVRLGNYTQILKKSVSIPGTLEATDRAGRAKEMGYQLLLKGKALKTDLESSVFANTARVTGSSSVARVLAGIPTWMTSNTDAGSGGADPTTVATTARTDGTQRAFTEAQLKAVLKLIWDNSGRKPDCMFLGSFNKQVASGFTGNSTRFDKGETKKLFAVIDVYEYDFGGIDIIPSRHVRERDAIVVTSDMWSLAELRSMFQERLAKTGDSEKFHVLMEATLVSRNEKASGIIADLTTS